MHTQPIASLPLYRQDKQNIKNQQGERQPAPGHLQSKWEGGDRERSGGIKDRGLRGGSADCLQLCVTVMLLERT